MITCIIEFYGLAAELAGMSEISVELPEGAGVPELVAALRKQVPSLEGLALKEGEDRIADTQILSYDGRFYHNEDRMIIKDGARIRLLTVATGG